MQFEYEGAMTRARQTGDRFPYLEISGDAQHRGHQYGRGLGDYIGRSVEIYRGAFERQGVSWKDALKTAGAMADAISRYSPERLVEMQGIAAGADLELEAVIALNARTEILYGRNPAAAKVPETDPDGCTGVVASHEITADGHTLHGQNWDWRDECASAAVILRINPDHGPRVLLFVEAGLLARCGMNSSGIAVTGNFLQSDEDFCQPGIPIALLRREILGSESLNKAVRRVYETQRAVSNNLMISDAGGEMINLETSPREVFWMHGDNGLLVHSNHFVTEAARAKLVDVGLTTNADSLYRRERVRRALEPCRGHLAIDDLKRVFADRYGAPASVCRSPAAGPGGASSSTVATILMDTTERTMWIAKQPYGPHEFHEYRLD